MPLFDIRDKGDINSLLDSVGPEIKAPGRIAVGILPDANDDPDARWNALQYRLAEQSLDLPQHREPNGTIIGGSPRVGIWLGHKEPCESHPMASIDNAPPVPPVAGAEHQDGGLAPAPVEPLDRLVRISRGVGM